LFIDIKSWSYHAMNPSKVKTRIGWGFKTKKPV
jgi:hypothetical protein